MAGHIRRYSEHSVLKQKNEQLQRDLREEKKRRLEAERRFNELEVNVILALG